MGIPNINPPGKTLSAYWENFLTDDELNYIISLDEWNNKTKAIVGLELNNDVNEKIRTSEVSWFHPNNENADLWIKFSNLFAQVNSQYFQFDVTGFYEPMQLTYYEAAPDVEKSGHYDWHMDLIIHEQKMMRKLSMVLMLSDINEFEGGDLQLHIDSSGPITLEQKKGRAWFFPSWVLHQVTPVTRGVRKTAVMWAGGPAFK